MENNDKKTREEAFNHIMMDILLRLATLENLLVNKGVFSLEDYKNEISDVTEKLANHKK